MTTHAGFACNGHFPADTLAETTKVAEPAIVQVRVEVKSRDILAIAEFVHGVQQDLFFDADAPIARKQAFEKERAMWMEDSGHSH